MTAPKSMINRFMPWRFALFFALLLAACAVAMTRSSWSQGLLIGFDVAAIAFIVSLFPTFAYDAPAMRRVAAVSDANRLTLLVVSFLLSVVIMAAVTAELAQAEELTMAAKALVAASLVIVWLFGNAVYTLHYAHIFYTAGKGRDCRGLEFPGTKEPLMADFVYFAYTLGVAVQTSDVIIESRHIRKVATAHCVAGFFFNLGVLALTINVLASR